MHTDPTEGFADLVTLRWMWLPGRVARWTRFGSSDGVSTLVFTLAAQNDTATLADSFIHVGRSLRQRHSEIKELPPGPPDLSHDHF